MLPVVDRPVVQYVVDELAAAGMRRILLVTARGKAAIEDHFDAGGHAEAGGHTAAGEHTEAGDHTDAGPQILATRQHRPRGLGDAVACAEGFAAGRPVVVALGDAIISPPPLGTPGIVSRLIDAHLATGACATVAVTEVAADEVRHYGIVVPVRRGERMDVSDLIEKPAPGTVSSRFAIAARYVLGPEVFAALRHTGPDATGEIQLTDALRRMIADGASVVAVPLAAGERRFDTGTLEGYSATFLEYALRHPAIGEALRARAARLLDDQP
jgi:UTP--glucose-1-phosphate uridylyltransferase